jgi:hypothetical protein
MKRYPVYTLVAWLCLLQTAAAQLVIGNGTSLRSDNNSYIVLNNLGLTHQSATSLTEPVFKLTGNTTVEINSNTIPAFGKIEMAKANGITVKLMQEMIVNQQVQFSGGLLDLNGHNINLATGAQLLNESDNSRINSSATGEVVINVTLNAPAAANPGNLGAVITSTANLGNVRIARGHKTFPINGSNSITRYYTITPANNLNLAATLRFYYLDAELNGRTENVQGLWRSDNGGGAFQTMEYSGRSTGLNYVEKSGLDHFALFTLFDATSILPVSNLQFTAQRLNNHQVKLDWKTAQETDNAGFHIERKYEQETAFSNLGFVASLAPGGNSSQPLTYSKTDDNSYTGKTYYRLKQQDLNGQFAWSAIRIVSGSNSKTVALKVWPIPARDFFYVNVEGIEKDILQVYDMTGKLKLQLPVVGNTQHQVTQLSAGMYILRLASQKDLQQKVVVQ